jgi:hypothetical protein
MRTHIAFALASLALFAASPASAGKRTPAQKPAQLGPVRYTKRLARVAGEFALAPAQRAQVFLRMSPQQQANNAYMAMWQMTPIGLWVKSMDAMGDAMQALSGRLPRQTPIGPIYYR